MQLSLVETSIYVQPHSPVEFAISADATPIRVTIEWDAIQRMMGPASEDAGQVREFLQRHRIEIGNVIRARIAAHGVPITHQLTMSWDDLRLAGNLQPAPDAVPASPPAG
jgi:hypothetical protein